MVRMPCGCFCQVDSDGVILAFEAVCDAMRKVKPPIHPNTVRAHFKLKLFVKQDTKSW